MEKTHTYDGKTYIISDETPVNGDLVLTEKYGVWEFKDETGFSTAPMPYWANRHACKKLILKNNK
jgi:hypothetical protein